MLRCEVRGAWFAVIPHTSYHPRTPYPEPRTDSLLKNH